MSDSYIPAEDAAALEWMTVFSEGLTANPGLYFIAAGDANDAVFVGNFTKNPIAVAFSPEDDGKCATYFARWQSRCGDTGPWSLPVTMRIAA